MAQPEQLRVGDTSYSIYRLDALQSKWDVARLPYTLRILLENVLRNGTDAEVEAVAGWVATDEPSREISFAPARVLLQDFTGVPCVVDLAAMREVLRHATSCPNHPIDSGVKGLPKLTFRVKQIRDPRLLKGYLAVQIDVRGTVNGKPVAQTSYAVYQQRSNVISGVYSFGSTTKGQLALCLHAAEQSAQNLRRGGSGSSSAPTA